MKRWVRLAAGVLSTVSVARAQTDSAAAPATDDPGAAPSPSAPPESPEILEAREAFRLGSMLAKQGRWSDALAAFERSARIKEHPVTTYNLAYCARALGQFVRSYQSFRAALEPSAAAGGARLSEGFQTQARAYLVELKQRIAHATVTLGSPRMTIRVDGRAVAVHRQEDNRAAYFASPEETPLPASLPTPFDLWLDPGNHVFIVSQPGVADVTRLYAFPPGVSETLLFPEQRPAAPSTNTHADAVVTGRPDRTWAVVSLGVGAAGFVASGVFGILSLNLESTLESRCRSNVCSPADADDMDRMKRFADYATAGLVVGGVGTAVGAYLWFTAKPEREKAAVRVAPFVGVGSAGVTGRF